MINIPQCIPIVIGKTGSKKVETTRRNVGREILTRELSGRG
jgi:hypothetical protein